MPEEQSFLSIIEKHYNKREQGIIKKALHIAKRAHKGQMRKSGHPYIIHPLEIAIEVEKRYHDLHLTAAALLHDAVEDCEELEVDEIYDALGKEIGFLVEAVTKTCLKLNSFKQEFSDKTEKLLWAGFHNVACFILKLADRDHNLSSLDKLPPNKQVRISFETQAIYEPLGRVLDYRNKSITTLKEHQGLLDAYIEQYNLSTPKKLKDHLVGDYYQDFNAETFEEVYKNPDKVIWQTDDIEGFAELCENNEFDRSVKILSMHSEGKKKYLLFQFKQATLVKNSKKQKLQLKSLQS